MVKTSELFEVGICESCGEKQPASELKPYSGKMLCPKCFRNEKRKAQRLKDREKTSSVSTSKKSAAKSLKSSLKTSDDAIEKNLIPILRTFLDDLSKIFKNPIKLDLSPIKVEIVADSKSTRGRWPSATDVINSPGHFVNFKNKMDVSNWMNNYTELEACVLNLMSSRKKQWRPMELFAEIKLIHPNLPITPEIIKKILERLSLIPEGGAPPEMRVVRLSSRYISACWFNVDESLTKLDYSILEVLENEISGLYAKQIHNAVINKGKIKTTFTTVLNHLQALKSPGWDLISKVDPNKRAPFKITARGMELLR
ncbi:MAG: hypothetical protein ACTSRA_22070, partial [Promethearchaeota archaeon]